jgi:hypothetical protein
VAKGQKRSSREPKKPKKTAAERLKAGSSAVAPQIARMSGKNAAKKA